MGPAGDRAGGRTASSTTPGISRSKSVRLASRLSTAAARAGATFLSPAIAAHVREILLFREPGALFEEARLWGNLLSTQALTLNLFVPLGRSPRHAPDGPTASIANARYCRVEDGYARPTLPRRACFQCC